MKMAGQHGAAKDQQQDTAGAPFVPAIFCSYISPRTDRPTDWRGSGNCCTSVILPSKSEKNNRINCRSIKIQTSKGGETISQQPLPTHIPLSPVSQPTDSYPVKRQSS